MDNPIPLAERISLYFDGSCQENRNVTADTPAGWGVVVVRGDSGLGKGDGEVIEELSDHLAWRACIGETPLPLQFWKPGMR